MPAFFNRIRFRKSGGKPAHSKRFLVLTQVSNDATVFFVVRRAVQKQDHERVLASQLVQVRQEVFCVAVCFLAEQLRSVICQGAEHDGSLVRTGRQNYGFGSLDDPDFTDFYVVDEDAFVLDYDAPFGFVKACQVGRVFFKNFRRSLSLECA